MSKAILVLNKKPQHCGCCPFAVYYLNLNQNSLISYCSAERIEKCGKKIEKEYMKVLDNFLLVKYFDTDEESIFCSDECLQKDLSVETFYLDDDCEGEE